jgi:hypothetical protein
VYSYKFQQPLVIKEKNQTLVDALKELNCRSLPNGSSPFSFDIAITMAVIAGNPANCRFDLIERCDGGISIRFLKHEPDKKALVIARADLYKDPQRGGLHIEPQIAESNRRLGLGIALYLAAARILHITGNGTLHSNHHHGQLTPSAKALWEDLANNSVAFRRAENSYEFLSTVSASEEAQTWLSRIIRYATYDTHLEQSPLRKLRGATPASFRKPYGKFIHLSPAPYTKWDRDLSRLLRGGSQ